MFKSVAHRSQDMMWETDTQKDTAFYSLGYESYFVDHWINLGDPRAMERKNRQARNVQEEQKREEEEKK